MASFVYVLHYVAKRQQRQWYELHMLHCDRKADDREA